jgi:tetratricopeptide (TPR) repeat protein
MISFNQTLYILFLVLSIFACSESEMAEQTKENVPETTETDIVYKSPLGKSFTFSEPAAQLVAKYDSAKADFKNNPNDVDNIIWYGRRTAYLGQYREAIDIYTEGINQFPEDPRLYRHRGHRYISLRDLDKAITDLSTAARLIEGTENEIEPDGMPNAQNIPTSSLHGNIWYHLGLAHYLKGNMEEAYESYLNCREAMNNDDNLVSSTHWLYMIQRRMGNKDKAEALLEPIKKDMKIIENFSYYDLCQFYKGLLPIKDLEGGEAGPANDAVRYGLANWYFYNDKKEKAKGLLEEILSSDSWNSFGYIAAEQDYLRYFVEE